MGSIGPSWGRRHVIKRAARDDWRKKQHDARPCATGTSRSRAAVRTGHRHIGAAVNGGYGFLRVRYTTCRQDAFVALADIRRPADTPLWKLEDSLACGHCRDQHAFARRARIERVVRADVEYGWANP